MKLDYVNSSSDRYLFDLSNNYGAWSLAHELGHNMQRFCWTPNGTEEVTPNIFVLHAFQLVFKEKPWLNKIQVDKLKQNILLKYDFDFTKWSKNPYIALFIYTQLVNSFGWNSFKFIFREYESLSNKEKLFNNDEDKWDQWIIRFSSVVGLDVSPLFYFWNIPFSEKPSLNLKDLTPWLPSDEITKMFPDRVDHVKRNYNGLLIGNEAVYMNVEAKTYPDDFEFDSIEKLEALRTRNLFNI